MEQLVVACVQQKMRLPASAEEHREDLRRFLRLAAQKRARLVVFPELAGVMVAPPLLSGFQAGLLKRADNARRRQSSLWQGMVGSLADAAARMLDIDFRRLMAGLLAFAPEDLWSAYDDLYGGLAREFDVTLIAPSAYLPDPLDGIVRNLSAVYGPAGERLGVQAKGVLHPEDEDVAQPGSEWRVIQSAVGRIGLMIGSDILYPEVGRLLAYQGAEILIGQGAATDRTLYEKLRSGMLARMQENQLFGAVSFLVGHNDFSRRQRQPFVGKSAILAPQELTPRSSGILVEMTSHRSESVLAAVWDFPALADLWETSDTPVRSRLPVDKVGPILAQLYQRMEQLPRRPDVHELPPPDNHNNAGPRYLDDLPVLASVTARWPLEDETEMAETGALDADDGADEGRDAFLRSALNHAPQEGPNEQPVEDETEEMDALLEPTSPEDEEQT